MDNSISGINSEISTPDTDKQSTKEFFNVVAKAQKEKPNTDLDNSDKFNSDAISNKAAEQPNSTSQDNFTFEELFPFEAINGENSLKINIGEFFSGPKGEKRKAALEMLSQILENSSSQPEEVNNGNSWQETI